MALLPDKEKLLRNFLRCANWEEKYLYIIELGQRLQNYVTKTKARKIASGLPESGVDCDASKCAGNY